MTGAIRRACPPSFHTAEGRNHHGTSQLAPRHHRGRHGGPACRTATYRRDLRRDRATGLYDTALAAYKDANATYAKGRFNAVVILTDGADQDPGSMSPDVLVKKLKQPDDPKRPVPLIAIAVGPDADKRACEQLAAATGGSGHRVSDPAEIHSVMLKSILSAGAG
ncbi:hypothetical protein ABZW18_28335 [Streptomyces sp. NPDC004647]|uniref:hypothetical protein n=1 Tax=Streptomyces sp. NPDC004647 TaxID=3154671 RepID=UPI0033A04BF1